MNFAIDHGFRTDDQRNRLFAGDVFFLSAAELGSYDLLVRAQSMVQQAWRKPSQAHKTDKSEFIRIASSLKTRATNTQEFFPEITRLLGALGQDTSKIYFDPPRIRIAPPSDYLTSGVSYAYAPHRDTWYGHPICAVNYWMPLFDITHENCLALFPTYCSRAIRNTSAGYDHDKWVSTYRFKATEQITAEARPHPMPTEDVDRSSELRVVGNPGDLLIFSSQQLHGTVPNTSGITRFSIDFRTVHIDDLLAARGAKNVDCRATGSALSGYVRASDFEPLRISPEHLPGLHPPPR